MTESPNLALPYLQSQQAQKHVTSNEALRRLDALVQLAVLSRTLADEPGAPAEGDRYLLPDSPAGPAWTGQSAGTLMAFQDGAWEAILPREGWLAFVADEGALAVFREGVWSLAGRRADMFGVNTSADETHRLTVRSDAELLTHDDITPGSGDARKIINRADSAKAASVLFQTGFSGQAEFGLIGDDHFRLKVSADGSSFSDVLLIDTETGRAGFGGVPTAQVSIQGTNMTDPSIGDLHIEKSGYFALLFLDTYGASAASFSIQRRARGTSVSPEAVLPGDTLGGFSFRGYGASSAFVQTALMHAVVDDTVSGSEVPAALAFGAGRTSAVERMRITSAGRVGIGTSAPSCALHVAGPARVASVDKASLPSASDTGAGAILHVPDEAGGAVLAFSDGTNWRRVTDRAVVS
ncbi:DUF2793 domain-containing protein [Hyphomonas sp.]|uniref:DUF2793 domain-containing protein n=1 Tax=Hyphomonas sp. TaxID=87 RepID=UPI00391CDD44